MNGSRRHAKQLTVVRSGLVLVTLASQLFAGGGLLFAGAQRLETGDTPLAVAAQDFDRDGYVDLLFAGGFTPNQTLRSVRGVGTGAFVGDVVQFDNTGTSVVSLMTADFDGDGLLDAALADTGSKRIRVWMDDDESSWPPFVAEAGPDIYAATFAPTAMAAGDIDGDGDLDLVYGGKNEVGIFLNDGQGFTYAAGTTFGGAYSATAVVLADLSGDGLDDLILATPVRIRVFESLGGGVFGAWVSVYDAGVTADDGLAVADLDQDGALDLVAAFTTGVAWLPGDGQGGFASPVALTGIPAQRLLVDDLDADGLADVVVADDEAVRTVLSHGDGTFTEMDGVSLLLPLTDLVAGDVNGDGRRDVVVSHVGGIAVLENLGDGRWPRSVELATPMESGAPVSPAAADLDGDGDLDVVVSVSNAPRIYVNPAAGASWENPLILEAGDSVDLSQLFVTDVDGSLGPDIVARTLALVVWPYTYMERVSVWLNTGPLTFAEPVVIALPDDSGDVALSDLDLDGDPDIVAAASYGVFTLLNDGSGAFSAAMPATSGPGGSPVLIDDFDGDGWPDMAMGLTALFQGQGDGTFVYQTTAGAYGDRVRTGDVDGDGLPDLIFSHDAVVVRINQGSFGFGPAIAVPTGQPGLVKDARAADVDGVPGAEIVCASDRQLFVLRQQNGSFEPHSGYAAKDKASSLLLADMDADGDLEAVLGVSHGADAVITVLEARASDPWKGLSGGLAGAHGLPELSGTGGLRPGTPMNLRVSRAAPVASVVLVAGLQTLNLPFKGGTLVPAPQLSVFGLATSALGTLGLSASWPAGLSSGQGLTFQAWIADAAGPAGFAATNALMAVQP